MPMHEYQKQMYKKVGIIVALIVLPIAGFFAGMQYQKQTSTTPTASNMRGQFARGGMRNRAIGTVKSISASSITVTSRQDNTDKTYTITSDTTYKNGTSAAQASDVQAGDTVLVTLDPTDSTKATQITINPSFQRPSGTANGGSTQGSTDNSGGDAILQ